MDVITTTGHVNVDFADVRTVMSHTGRAVMGMGVSRGTNGAIEAAQKAICSPLHEEGTVEGARGVLLNITGGPDLALAEASEATSFITRAADPEANVIYGIVTNENMRDAVRVTVIATGFDRDAGSQPAKKRGPLLASNGGYSTGERGGGFLRRMWRGRAAQG